MTTVVLQLRDEDLRAGRIVGRVQIIRPGGAGGPGSYVAASTIRGLTDLAAILAADHEPT